MISKIFLVGILVAMAFADSSSSEEEKTSHWHLHWHVIPEDEAAAKLWSEKANMPWEQTKKIVDIKKEVREATTWTDKLKKMKEGCEYITTTPDLDVTQWKEPETWKEWKKTWMDQSLKMAHWAEKVKTADNEHAKMTLVKKICWEMLN